MLEILLFENTIQTQRHRIARAACCLDAERDELKQMEKQLQALRDQWLKGTSE
jgi:acetolactate synthase small subunit